MTFISLKIKLCKLEQDLKAVSYASLEECDLSDTNSSNAFSVTLFKTLLFLMRITYLFRWFSVSLTTVPNPLGSCSRASRCNFRD